MIKMGNTILLVSIGMMLSGMILCGMAIYGGITKQHIVWVPDDPVAPSRNAIVRSLTNGFLLVDPLWPGKGYGYARGYTGAVHVIVPVDGVVIDHE